MLNKPDAALIKKTAKLLQIPEIFVRKDVFVTNAIYILSQVKNDYFSLVFQGGTSLAKLNVIKRMSEDVDFRVIQTEKANSLGKEARRKALRDYRYELVDALTQAEFNVDDTQTFYEGRFFRIPAQFDRSEAITYLKPHVAIELFLGDVRLASQKTSITTLVKTILPNESDDKSCEVNCVSLDETAAEKWVALMRRVSGSYERQRRSDKHLVRHLYDLSMLLGKEHLTGDYKTITQSVIESDKKLFNKYNDAYKQSPIDASKKVLDLLFTDKRWQAHWSEFLDQMVYDREKPSFLQACEQLRVMSQVIHELEQR